MRRTESTHVATITMSCMELADMFHSQLLKLGKIADDEHIVADGGVESYFECHNGKRVAIDDDMTVSLHIKKLGI